MKKYLLIILILIQSSSIALADEYTPTGFYDVDYLTLDNGLKVILKKREGARNASIRLVVGTGYLDYEFGKQETPHLLEHAMFSGTTKHSETELDELVNTHGGSWNAFTEPHTTIYTIDIYSKYTNLGIETLYEMMTDSVLSMEGVESSRNIVSRELNNDASPYIQFL